MKTKYFIGILCFVFIVGLFFPTNVQSQSPAFRIPVIVTDSIFDASWILERVAHDTVLFGVHPDGTLECDDLSGFQDHWLYSMREEVDTGRLVEEELPPNPPEYYLIIALTNVKGGCGRSLSQIHQYISSSQKDTFKLAIQIQGLDDFRPNQRITMTWPTVLSEYSDSLRLSGGGQSADMHTQSRLNFVPPGNSTIIWIYMTGPKLPPVPPARVQLTSPPYGDTIKLDHTTFQWNAVADAFYYRLQVGKDTFFTSNKILDTIITATSCEITKLKSMTRYYWKVYVATPYGLSYFQSPPFNFFVTLAPDPPTRVTPTNGSTNIQLDPRFIWRKASSISPVTYQLQLATDTSFLPGVIVKDTSLSDTTVQLASILQNCYRYYWRINASNADGVGLFSGPWNFRTVLTVPSIPVLASPADNADDVSLSPSLTWNGDVCSDNYRVVVGLDSLFNQIIVNANTNQSSYTLSGLLQDTTYYWKVKAKNVSDSSEFSSFRRFKTSLQPAGIPTLVSPANGDTTQEPIGTLVWRRVPYAERYHLQISRFQNFSSFEFNDSTLTDTSRVTTQLMNCSTYYWKVRAINQSGSEGFATARSFKIKTALPGAPVLIYPPNEKDSLVETVTLRWQAGDACTHSYFFHVSQSASFTDTVAIGSSNDTDTTLSNLRGNVYYYWRVKARNYLGDGPWSDTWRFHTIRSTPDVPVLIYPPNGSGDMPSCITFKWDSAAFADSYRLQVAFDSTFTNIFFNDSTIQRQLGVQPSKQVCGLLNSRTYYWRVNAKNDIGVSSWSAIRKFVTLYPPTAPTLNSPENGAKDISISPTFVWSVTERATVYQLEVALNPIFSIDSVVFSDTTITQISWQVNWLQPYKDYYWRVRGKNSAGWGSSSPIWTFKTTRVGPGNWLIPLTVAETGPERQTIYFGVNPYATSGIDPSQGEYELPPVQMGFFDARFISPYIGEGLIVDYHKFSSYSQVDTFQFMYQPGMGSFPMKISWPQSFVKIACDSMVIADRLVAPTIRARMDIDSTLTINNFTINSLYIVSYGAFPVPVDVKPITPDVPRGFVLYQNFPNPFNPTTKINFSTDQTTHITLTIYDILGQEVVMLANTSFFPGVYTLEWNGKNVQGIPMPSGVYYIRMIASNTVDGKASSNPFISTRKMLMMK